MQVVVQQLNFIDRSLSSNDHESDPVLDGKSFIQWNIVSISVGFCFVFIANILPILCNDFR